MPIELEAAVADQLGDRHATHGPAPAPGARCANCDAVLEGRYCHDCGQLADQHKRAIHHLAWEMVEDLFHLDGRLRRTLPDLFLRPGRLARDYIEGRLARHVPPFRMFLVSLLLFIFAAEHAAHELTLAQDRQREAHAAALRTPAGRAAEAARMRKKAADDRDEALREAAGDRRDDLKDGDPPQAVAARYARASATAAAVYNAAMAKADRAAQGIVDDTPARVDLQIGPSDQSQRYAWFKGGLRKAVDNPEYYLTVMFGWAHRLAVLLLPIVGLSLALVYRNKPALFIHDHMLVAMDLLSFAFLTNAVGLVLPEPANGWWLGAVAWWTPVNMFQTLRGAYGSGVLGALLKTVIVWMISVTAFGMLLTALLVFTLSQI